MKVLVVGGGGREHALCWKLAQSSRISKLFCAPGNAGISLTEGKRCGKVECVGVAAEDLDGLLRFARRERFDLTVVGPEIPLTMGLADRWQREQLPVFGPGARGAELEGSKVFTKTMLRKFGIPTADFVVLEDYEQAKNYLESRNAPCVVKADGLAAGKGVVVAANAAEASTAAKQMLIDNVFGSAGRRIVIEECLTGEEVSLMAFTDGETLALLPSAQDHKRVGDGDQGPNTGGMGAYSPTPCLTAELEERVVKEIFIPTLHALRRDDRPYRGILYAGLMLTEKGPMLLEYNCRFGDPECQCLLPRVENDLVDVMEAVVCGRLRDVSLKTFAGASVCVIMASGGYPGPYKKNLPIFGLDRRGQAGDMDAVFSFHSGTVFDKKSGKDANPEFLTGGGRVLGITALGVSLSAAVDSVYRHVGKIKFQDVHFRRDIARKGLERERGQ
jgi:phosphoribosylamine--glycine ligase